MQARREDEELFEAFMEDMFEQEDEDPRQRFVIRFRATVRWALRRLFLGVRPPYWNNSWATRTAMARSFCAATVYSAVSLVHGYLVRNAASAASVRCAAYSRSTSPAVVARPEWPVTFTLRD
ncbi:UNVERIFIED_CONTAM: hypothetical protein K2H54_001561 [Gekko kuhli]